MAAADGEELTPGEMRRWLQRLDKSMIDLQREVRDSFASLTFVTLREYERDREAADKFAEETRQIAASARAWVWAMFAVVCAAVLAAGLALVRAG